ncbi:MAG: prepilin-type N-terminal cleavage/methylation domain-containing protein [Phycisphaeraceae bacterium]|nr:MAG: prepilin-type N-terminal cleavage/methylation domain-containing protein [Phycisphaeraceae bacterium]
MRARAFTLIEILVVLALFVVVLSLVGPALMQRIAPMTFERTAEQIESALLLAREDARRTGAIVYVYAEADENGRGIRLVSRATPIDTSAAFRPAAATPDASLRSSSPYTSDEHAETLLLTLPDGFRLDHEAPVFESETDLMGLGPAAAERSPSPGDDAAADYPDIGGLSPDDATDLILVCIPDGSLHMPRDTWLIDADNRAASVRVDGAVGIVRLVEVKPPADGDEPGPGLDNLPPVPATTSAARSATREPAP